MSEPQLNMSSQVIAKHELILHRSNELMGYRLWVIMVSPLLSSQFAMEECVQFWMPPIFRGMLTLKKIHWCYKLETQGRFQLTDISFKLGPKDVLKTLNVNIFNWNICSLVPHSFHHSLLFYIQHSHLTMAFFLPKWTRNHWITTIPAALDSPETLSLTPFSTSPIVIMEYLV